MPRNCEVFLLLCELTRLAILWNGVLCKFTTYKENHAISMHVYVDHYILLLKHLANHIDFITNGCKRFSWTNSTDRRQHVPLKTNRQKPIFNLTF